MPLNDTYSWIINPIQISNGYWTAKRSDGTSFYSRDRKYLETFIDPHCICRIDTVNGTHTMCDCELHKETDATD